MTVGFATDKPSRRSSPQPLAERTTLVAPAVGRTDDALSRLAGRIQQPWCQRADLRDDLRDNPDADGRTVRDDLGPWSGVMSRISPSRIRLTRKRSVQP
jgi:hypothetical protein